VKLATYNGMYCSVCLCSALPTLRSLPTDASGRRYTGNCCNSYPGPKAAPFNDSEWIFELKYDGFRALVAVEYGPWHFLEPQRSSLLFLQGPCHSRWQCARVVGLGFLEQSDEFRNIFKRLLAFSQVRYEFQQRFGVGFDVIVRSNYELLPRTPPQ
jgi:hypothetical protein